jgi:hypothetical protein
MEMTRILRLAPLLSLFALGSCSRPRLTSETSQEKLIEILLKAKVIEPALVLLHASYTCDLIADGVPLRVVDVRQIEKTAGSPRGFNHIVVFNPDWQLVQEIQYVDQRPLFCKGNELALFGDIALHNELPEGDVLAFQNKGDAVVVRSLDYNSLPTFEEARGFPK